MLNRTPLAEIYTFQYVLSKENDITVVLDIELSEDLINEGLLREIIRNAQVLRKEADFKIDSRICLDIKTANENMQKIVLENKDKIMQETLATSFGEQFEADIQREFEIDGAKLLYSLKEIK